MIRKKFTYGPRDGDVSWAPFSFFARHPVVVPAPLSCRRPLGSLLRRCVALLLGCCGVVSLRRLAPTIHLASSGSQGWGGEGGLRRLL